MRHGANPKEGGVMSEMKPITNCCGAAVSWNTIAGIRLYEEQRGKRCYRGLCMRCRCTVLFDSANRDVTRSLRNMRSAPSRR